MNRKTFYTYFQLIRIFFIMLCFALLALAGHIFIARHTSITNYGDFNIILEALSFLFPIVTLGSSGSISKFLSLYYKENDAAAFYGYLSWNKRLLSIVLISISTIAIILSIVAIVIDITHHHYLSTYLPFIFAIFLIPWNVIFRQQAKLLNSMRLYELALLPNKVLYFIIQIIIIAIFVSFKPRLQMFDLIIILAISKLLTILINFIYIKQNLKRLPLTTEKLKYHSQDWIKVSLQLLLATFLFATTIFIQFIILKIYYPHGKEVGLLGAINVIAAILITLSTTSRYYITPKVAHKLQHQQYKELNQQLNMINNFKIIRLVIFGFLIIFFGKDLLALFGAEYTKAYTDLIWLTLIYAFTTAFSLPNQLLSMGDCQVALSVFEIIAIVLNIAAGVIFIPFFGLNGSIIAIAIAAIITTPLKVFYSRYKLKVKSFYII